MKYNNENAADWSFDTRAIHAGQPTDTPARNLPIYLTSSFVFKVLLQSWGSRKTGVE